MFENSTVCHLVDGIGLCALSMACGLGCCLGLMMILAVFLLGFVVRVLFFCRFSMESLILAQDERWRRA
jgi:hypothetical protein